MTIKHIQIYGERCSGTNYLYKLFQYNFGIEACDDFGHKHWHPLSEKPQNNYDIDEYLFVCIYRNPYDWLRSMYGAKWHFPQIYRKSGFNYFIRNQWWSVVSENDQTEIMDDRNPRSDGRYDNVLCMRRGKIQSYFDLRDGALNVYIINYDELVVDYARILLEISMQYNIPLLSDGIYNSYTYKDWSTPYIPRTYPPFRERDFQFINNNLDWEFESMLGYKAIEDHKNNYV